MWYKAEFICLDVLAYQATRKIVWIYCHVNIVGTANSQFTEQRFEVVIEHSFISVLFVVVLSIFVIVWVLKLFQQKKKP